MKLFSKPYKFGSNDTALLRSAGYEIISGDSSSLEDFMIKIFPNFDVMKLINQIEKSFTHTTSRPISRKIIINASLSALTIDYRNEYTTEDDALLFVRDFTVKNSEICVNHRYCVLPELYRGKGYIKPVFQESLQQYINMSAKKLLFMLV